MRKTTSRILTFFAVGLCLAAAVIFSGQRASTMSSAGEATTLTEAESKPETRCGWFSNPTPGNAWLNDKDGEWLIGAQGGFQAEGDWAEFADNQWVKTNGNYGYGCSCMKVTTDKKERRILTIENATARPLSACRKDKKLKEPK